MVCRFLGRRGDPNELRFDGLTYRKISERSMQILLRTKDSEGKVPENIINCNKANK